MIWYVQSDPSAIQSFEINSLEIRNWLWPYDSELSQWRNEKRGGDTECALLKKKAVKVMSVLLMDRIRCSRLLGGWRQWWWVPGLWKEAGCLAFSSIMDDAILAAWQITRGPSGCLGWDGYVRGYYVDKVTGHNIMEINGGLRQELLFSVSPFWSVLCNIPTGP